MKIDYRRFYLQMRIWQLKNTNYIVNFILSKPVKTIKLKGFDNFKVIPKDRQYMFTINKKLDFCVTQQCKRKVKLKIRDEKNYYEEILNRRM